MKTKVKKPEHQPENKPKNIKEPLQWVHGPLASRRFGRSITLNFGQPGHACHWHCVYCPWLLEEKPALKGKGRAKKVPRGFERPPGPADFCKLVEKAVSSSETHDLQTIVLGSNTEPTLYPEFPSLVSNLIELRKESGVLRKLRVRLIALSNGLGFEQPGVEKSLEALDEVWLKVDCVEPKLHQKVIDPDKKTLSPTQVLKVARKLNNLHLQTTLWREPGQKDFQNWSAENLRSLLGVYSEVRPKSIHLRTVRRQRVHLGAQPISAEEMEAFALRVGELGIPTEIFE